MIWFLLSTAYELVFLWFLWYNPQNNLHFSERHICWWHYFNTRYHTHTQKIVELWLLIALKTAPICSFMCIKISRYLDYHYVYLFFCWSIRQIKIFQYWRSDKIIFVDWKCKGTSGKPSVKFFMGIPLFLPDPNWQLTIDSSQYRKFAFYNEGTSMLVDL